MYINIYIIYIHKFTPKRSDAAIEIYLSRLEEENFKY